MYFIKHLKFMAIGLFLKVSLIGLQSSFIFILFKNNSKAQNHVKLLIWCYYLFWKYLLNTKNKAPQRSQAGNVTKDKKTPNFTEIK